MSKFISDGTGIIVEDELQVQSTAPNVTIKNTTAEDTDGGRECDIDFHGTQSGGEVSTLARIRARHAGSADDEKGRVDMSVNDGNDGTAPSLTVLSLMETGYARVPLGLLFGSDTAAANALDDYEEGTWTPSVGGTATYLDQTGTYTKIGNTVVLSCGLTVDAIGTGSTSAISGIPFASSTNNYMAVYFYNVDTNYTIILCSVGASNVVFSGLTAASNQIQVLTPITSLTTIRFTITYQV